MIQRVCDMLDKGMLTEPLNIKIPTGFASFTEVQINAIGEAVGLHVQAVFNC